jgi:hypothetical protein
MIGGTAGGAGLDAVRLSGPGSLRKKKLALSRRICYTGYKVAGWSVPRSQNSGWVLRGLVVRAVLDDKGRWRREEIKPIRTHALDTTLEQEKVLLESIGSRKEECK